MSPKLIEKYCKIDDGGKKLVKRAMDKMGLSARSYARILKVSRTIADLDYSNNIKVKHIAEAISFRSLDRDGWLG